MKIDKLNHSVDLEKDKIEIEQARAAQRNLMNDRMREAKQQAQNAALDPNHMVFNIRNDVTHADFMLDPNNMKFNFRK